MWNTYGPTEATVVACAAQLTGDGPGADRAAAGRLGARRRRRRGRAGRDGRERRAGDRRGRARPLPRHRARTPRSSRRCRRWAGSAPTAAATSCAPTRPGCCSSGAPTSRSSSAGGASSWARSTPRCSALPGVRGAAAAVRRTRGGQPGAGGLRGGRQRRAGHRRRGARPARAAARRAGAAARGGRRRCRRARRARSTGTRCPGRCPRRAASTPSRRAC